MKVLKESVIAIQEGPIFDKAMSAMDRSRSKIGSSKKPIANDYNELYSIISKEIKNLNSDYFKSTDVVNDNLVIGNEDYPTWVLIPKKNLVTDDNSNIVGFWAGFDCEVASNNSDASKFDGLYRKYSKISDFIDDLKSGVIRLATGDY